MAGTIWYVGTTGSDSNAGTIDQPFATVAAANAVVQPGDKVYFLAGEYHNATYGDGNVWKDGQDTILKINGVNGSAAGGFITYAAAPGAHVVLKYDGNGAIRLSNSSYVRIEGFDIQGPNGQITLQQALDYQFAYKINNAGPVLYRDPAATLTQSVASQGGDKPVYFNSNAIAISAGSNHVEIIGNAIHDSPGHAIASLNGADYVTIRGNDIYKNTWFSSNGNHAVSFKNIQSSDLNDGVKIVVEGNRLADNYNRLVSWALLKTAPVTMAIDEGKGLHFQDDTAALGFTHGQILVDDNLVVRSGNAGITESNVERITIANNTLVDNGRINQLIAAGLADPNVAPGFTVAAGGLRIADGSSVKVVNNLISINSPTLNAVDATPTVTAASAMFANNLYAGGSGLLLRSGDATLAQGFNAIASPGFVSPASGDYRLLAGSPARDAGSSSVAALVGSDINGVPRSPLAIDVGAFEFVPPAIVTIGPPSAPTKDPSLQVTAFAMPTTAFTFEMLLAIPSNPGSAAVTIASYDSEFRIDARAGFLDVYIHGVKFTTTIATSALVGTTPHRVSVTWDNATGQASAYLDGVASGAQVVAQGVTLRSGNPLTLGTGGASVPTPNYGYGDVRIFDHVRTPTQIADLAATTLATPGIEPGLIGYWTGANASTLASQVAGVGDIVLDEDYVNYARGAKPATINTGNALLDSIIGADLQSSVYAAGTVLTYTFDLSPSIDPNDPLHWNKITPAMQVRAKQLLQAFTNLTGIPTVEVAAADQDANLYFALSDNVPTAYTAVHRSGVIDVFQNGTSDPVPGGYVDHLMLHELGHALALPHPVLPAGYASHDYSLMTGYAFEGAPASVFSDNHGPETWMGADIAALQYQFGANFNFNAGDTIYSFSPTTGESFVDGVSQGVGNNQDIFRTIWDGGGSDTYDLSNYGDNLTIDLAPGRFSTFSAGQLTKLGTLNGVAQYAKGNVGNAFQYYGDARSLIENAIGGRGDDAIAGNQAANHLTGGAGSDRLSGLAGNDTLDGGAGNDSVDGGIDNDRIIASTADGNDTITGGFGFDILDFSAVGGVVQVNQFAGTVTGTAGNDVLTDVIEQIVGSNFNDVLAGGNGINVLDGNGGDDQLYGNGGQDLLRGGDGNDTFYASVNDGNDTLLGGTGFDVLDYSSLPGVVQVNQYAGITTGTANNDTLQDVFEMVIGSAYGDVLAGGDGVNGLVGGAGNDSIFGNGGQDYLRGGTGNDEITMGTGDDTLDMRAGDQLETILDFVAGGTEDSVDLHNYGLAGITTFVQLQASGRLATVAGHAELALDGGDKVIFQNVASHTLLTAADFKL